MQMNMLFRKSRNELEKGGRLTPNTVDTYTEITEKCPKCGKEVPITELWSNSYVCRCGHYFRMSARQRIDFLTDKDGFEELFADMESENLLDFPGYTDKLQLIRKSTGEKEAVICGTGTINGEKCALFVMNPYFMMGSMGTVVGEKITLLFEYATEHGLPVVGCTVSGGARMQEGLLSLMQMAKTSGAVRQHSEKGNLYITMLTDPTTGGVTASFAMEGDIILAEPRATIGFAGARVIEQTVRKKLPQGFQTAEFLLEHGFVDAIVPRSRQKKVISWLLAAHRKEADA